MPALLEKVRREYRGTKSWSQPPFWAADALRLPFLGTYPLTPDRETIEVDYESYARDAYKASGVVFALIATRQMVFAEARFLWRQLFEGRPGRLYRTDELDLLENPWPGGTTGELLGRMEVTASLAGNYYGTTADDNGRIGNASRGGPNRRIVHMRPDWVTIVVGSRSGSPYALDAHIVGYLYEPKPANSFGGPPATGDEGTLLLPEEVIHFSPLPDPQARFRGMSWLTPLIREVQADKAATVHKAKFFENGATPNMVIKFDKDSAEDAFDEFVDRYKEEHQGAWNSYKTLFLSGGADIEVVGADFRQMDFSRTQGKGEPLALDTPVPTPTGWTTMGDIRPGDRVLGRNGRPANVLAASSVHLNRRCYRISLKNGDSIVADASHLWAAVDRNTASRAERTYTTQELYDLSVKPYPNGIGGFRLSLPEAPTLELPEADLLVDPYVLGAWLGDGQTAGAAICGAWDDLKYIASEIEARGYATTHWESSGESRAVIGIPGGLLTALAALGVLGAKRIPDPYLRASVGQRLDLLCGLMDTDGSVGHNGQGQCEYSSKDEHLARQVLELVRSLGYRASIVGKADLRSRTGQQWRVRFRSRPDCIPFLLPRKIDRCVEAGEPHFSGRRSVISIEPVASVPVRCITVDTEDHLFLAGKGFVPTHNSRIAAAAGVPPSWVGFSEGLQGSALNSGNYNAARRRFADGTMRPLWRMAASSLAVLAKSPSKNVHLWYDDRDIPFLRVDARDAAEISRTQAVAIRQLTDSGFEPDAAVEAVLAMDLAQLSGKHSGLFSVQLRPPQSMDDKPDVIRVQILRGNAPPPSNEDEGQDEGPDKGVTDGDKAT